eukprot:9247921-Alexandrium_andersonii.AAC.1
MSASLVGSEMCIRDRPEAAEGRLQPRAAMGSTRRPRAARGSLVMPPWGCLLYTSDAADDM